MKKTKSAPPQVHLLLLATLFIMGLITAFAMASYNYNPLVVTNTKKEYLGYDAMGYGRGMKNGKELISKETCLMDGCLYIEDAEYPVAQLDEKTTEYLKLALSDERKALATYEAIMDRFGRVRPFINISRAEEQHITTLLALFDKYGVEIPDERNINVDVPNSLSSACAISAQAEIANEAMYMGMIDEIKERDIVAIFSTLASASKTKHLPAFEYCSEVN